MARKRDRQKKAERARTEATPPVKTGGAGRLTPRTRALLLVVLAAVLAHGLCLNSVFYQDDYPHFINSGYFEAGRWYLSIPRLLPSLSHYLTYKVCGSRFWSPAFHLGNLLVHVGTALALYLALREMIFKPAHSNGALGRAGRSEGGGLKTTPHDTPHRVASGPQPERTRRGAERVAFWAAMIFACHPLATEVTNYMRARDIGMATFFSVLAAWFTARWVRRGWRWAPPVLLAVLAASMSKEVGVAFAVVAVLATAAMCFEDPLRSLWKLKWWIAGAFGTTVLLHVGFYKFSTIKGVGSAWSLVTHPQIGYHVLSQGRVFWMYAARMVLPVGLCSDHLVPWTFGAGDPVAWIGLVGTAALASLVVVLPLRGRLRRDHQGALLTRGRRREGIFLGLALFPLLLRFPLFHNELMVEYRAYPAVPWFAALAATGLEAARRYRSSIARTAGPVLVGVLIALSAARCVTWWDMERLLRDCIDKYPGHGRAVVCLQEHRYREKRFKETIALRPELEDAYRHAERYNATHRSRKQNIGMFRYWYFYGTALVARSEAALGRTADGYRTVNHLFARAREWGVEDDPRLRQTHLAFVFHARARVHIAAGRLYKARDDLERVMKMKPLYSHHALLREVKRLIAEAESRRP